MKTTAEEKATKLLKRKQKKKNNENEAVKKKWIFFDFECTQDKRIQSNEGYNLSSILCVEIAINPIVIPIHANKDTFQIRCQFAQIVTHHPVVPSIHTIYVSYIKFA